MTDRIDLDELDETEGDDEEWVEGEAEASFEQALWHEVEKSKPARSPAPVPSEPEPEPEPGTKPDIRSRESDTDSEPSRIDEPDSSAPLPHVPNSDRGKPAGIPKEQDGQTEWKWGNTTAGTGDRATIEEGSGEAGKGEAGKGEAGAGGRDVSPPTEEDVTASGPHGGGVDDMTLAVTYGAARRLATPSAVVADAQRWADWLGIVGDVPAHVINKFQREHAIDVDFFSGTDPPGERLERIDEHSMFYAERMVVVGVEDEDEAIAETAGWEFVPVSKAAEQADWTLSEPSDD